MSERGQKWVKKFPKLISKTKFLNLQGTGGHQKLVHWIRMKERELFLLSIALVSDAQLNGAQKLFDDH